MARRWKVLGLVSLGVFMVSLDLFIVNIAFPEIEGDFAGSSVSSISWVLNAYAIVLAALMVSAGRLADRHGRRRAFLWGLAIFVLGSALCGAARLGRDARRGARRPGRRRRAAAPHVPRTAAAGVRAARALARDRHLGRHRRPCRGRGPAGRRPARRDQLAARLPRQRPGRVAAIVYGVHLLRESRDETQERPDLLGSALIVARRRACSRSGSSKGPSGAGAMPARSARWRPPQSAWPPSGRAA